MDRKHFLKKGILGLGSIVALPKVITRYSNDKSDPSKIDCDLSPRETAGPFPNKTPTQLVRENIIGDRTGVALLLTLTIQDQSNGCQPLSNVWVDVWHCDSKGYYSQYGGHRMQRADFTLNNFLRGRQKTDANGQVSFISIFPGWYPGRAPHIHLEILDSNEKSIRVTQIAFPKDVCDMVYTLNDYKGEADTQNEQDNVFSDSLDANMSDSISGNTTDGFILSKTIVV